MDGLAFDYTHVEQPLAEAVLSPDHCRDYDALVFYDMPGIRFGEGGRSLFHRPPPLLKISLHY